MVYKPDKANVPPAESYRRNSALCDGDEAELWALSVDAFDGAKCQFELELPLRSDHS